MPGEDFHLPVPVRSQAHQSAVKPAHSKALLSGYTGNLLV